MTYRHLPYRPNVGLCLVNTDGLIFAGKRLDFVSDAWQMPQGGIDHGEDPETAALRELSEETGVTAEHVSKLAEMKDWLPYELPKELIGQFWGGKFRGQRQKWYCYRFQGHDSDINIIQKHQEFSQWQWMKKQKLIEKIIPFKREIYEKVLEAFSEFLD